MTKDIMNRAYITPKRIVTKYAGCKNNLIKDEHYLLERGNGQSEIKLSYKVKHSVENSPEKQVIFENHHEPIIDLSLIHISVPHL